MSNLVFYNGKVTTLDTGTPEASAIAVSDGKVVRLGQDREVLANAPADATRIDLDGRRVIPGLNDSHTHLIRGGLSFNMELRWEGVPSLADALALLKDQVDRTPAPQWVRVIGGWSEFQFADLAVLNAPYLEVDDEDLRDIESEMTIMNGKVVYGSGDFADRMGGLEAIQPEWSPVRRHGGYYSKTEAST